MAHRGRIDLLGTWGALSPAGALPHEEIIRRRCCFHDEIRVNPRNPLPLTSFTQSADYGEMDIALWPPRPWMNADARAG